ncbi:MAG: hypothetical protein ABIJ96_18385 [Elusimicrobiota bacterium]
MILSSLSLRGRRQLRRRLKRWPGLLCAGLAAGFSLYLVLWSPLAAANWLESWQLTRHATPLTYDDVRRDPRKYAGKTIRWPMVPRGGSWYYKGDPARPIYWTASPPMAVDARHAVTVIASISSGKDAGDVVGEVLALVAEEKDAEFADKSTRSDNAPIRPAFRLRYRGWD